MNLLIKVLVYTPAIIGILGYVFLLLIASRFFYKKQTKEKHEELVLAVRILGKYILFCIVVSALLKFIFL